MTYYDDTSLPGFLLGGFDQIRKLWHDQLREFIAHTNISLGEAAFKTNYELDLLKRHLEGGYLNREMLAMVANVLRYSFQTDLSQFTKLTSHSTSTFIDANTLGLLLSLPELKILKCYVIINGGELIWVNYKKIRGSLSCEITDRWGAKEPGAEARRLSTALKEISVTDVDVYSVNFLLPDTLLLYLRDMCESDDSVADMNKWATMIRTGQHCGSEAGLLNYSSLLSVFRVAQFGYGITVFKEVLVAAGIYEIPTIESIGALELIFRTAMEKLGCDSVLSLAAGVALMEQFLLKRGLSIIVTSPCSPHPEWKHIGSAIATEDLTVKTAAQVYPGTKIIYICWPFPLLVEHVCKFFSNAEAVVFSGDPTIQASNNNNPWTNQKEFLNRGAALSAVCWGDPTLRNLLCEAGLPAEVRFDTMGLCNLDGNITPHSNAPTRTITTVFCTEELAIHFNDLKREMDSRGYLFPGVRKSFGKTGQPVVSGQYSSSFFNSLSRQPSSSSESGNSRSGLPDKLTP